MADGAAAARDSRLRPYLAIGVVYVFLVAGLYGISRLYRFGQPELTAFALVRLLLLGTAIAGLALLGKDQVGRVFGRKPSRAWIAIGPAVGLVCYAINCLWVLLSARLDGVPMPYVSGHVTVWTALVAPLLVAYTEELVFRGVLWAALEKVARSPLKPLLQTSVLFALVHLVHGGEYRELPHRFVSGLLLGLLRLRSGSMVPSVHAHFVVLALATVD